MRITHIERRSSASICPEGGMGVSYWLTIWLHPITGEVLAKYDLPRENLGRRMAGPINWGWHVGNWWGDVSRLLYGVLGFVPLLLSVTGTWVWLNKKQAQKRNRTRQGSAVAKLKNTGDEPHVR